MVKLVIVLDKEKIMIIIIIMEWLKAWLVGWEYIGINGIIWEFKWFGT